VESTTLGPRNVRDKPPSAPVTALRLLTSVEAFPLLRAAQVAAAKRRSRPPMELDLTTTSKFNVLEILATRIVAATNVDTAVTSQPSAPAPRDAVVRVIALTAVAKVAITATTLAPLSPMTASIAAARAAADATLIPTHATTEEDQSTRRSAIQREPTTLTPMPTTATRVTLAVIMMTTMTIFMTTAFTDLMQPRKQGLKKLRRQRLKRSLKLRRLIEKGKLINN